MASPAFGIALKNDICATIIVFKQASLLLNENYLIIFMIDFSSFIIISA
jgi:hypothetical protein